jgi:putative urate catabolism protein
MQERNVASIDGGGQEPAYPRDLIGYGRHPPHADWPGGARIAVQFVLNYEEGAENSILHGDAASEAFLSEIVSATPYPGQRHMSMESLYEYGSRAGVWRLLGLFEERGLPLTVFAVGMALARHPELARAFVQGGHEVASHGWRWIDYRNVPEAVEREHIARAVQAIRELTGTAPVGWYTGRTGENTRRLVAEHGGFLYDADSYADDLPYWEMAAGRPQLIVPYTLDTNDMRFVQAQGFHTGEQFFAYLRDAFDALYAEGEQAPKMLSIGLHCRLAGRPARIGGLARFLDHIARHDRVWICRREDIARHWIARHPPAMPVR